MATGILRCTACGAMSAVATIPSGTCVRVDWGEYHGDAVVIAHLSATYEVKMPDGSIQSFPVEGVRIADTERPNS